MENAIETTKVISIEKREYTDKETGEKKPYCVVTSLSTHNEVFIFNDYQNVPNINDVYGMFLTHDRYRNARITYQKMK